MRVGFTVVLVSLGLSATAFASPRLTHSGRVLDANGAGVNGSHSVVVSLEEEDGDVPFTEPHTVTFEDGYYAVVLGTVNVLDAGVFDEPLDVVVAVDGQELGRSPLTAVPKALSVDGLVRVSAAPTECGLGQTGALRFSSGRLSVCDGVDWTGITGSKLLKPMTLLVNNDLTDEHGNFTFSSTSAIRFDAVNIAEGSHSLTAAIYGSDGTGTPDWAAQSATSDSQWSLGEDYEDWAWEWEYRHTGDTGYGRILMATSTLWANQPGSWCPPSSPSGVITDGWMMCMYWGASRFYFHGTGGNVSWPYVGYHSDWKTLRLQRDGSSLEFFIDGVSQGVKTAPSTGPDVARTLYLSGSTNGGQGSYSPGQMLTERSQMDNIRFGPR